MKNILLQAIKFTGISGIGWSLDFCSYVALGLVSDNLAVNNILSSWTGVTFVFMFATRRVFQNSSKIPLKYKYFIYLLYQSVLIVFISKVLDEINMLILNDSTMEIIVRFSSVIAKILVTPITMVLNFLVMKGVIEKL
ncbi:hypothetical protein C805_00483 [Eubacterium sp. 14-2]|uniref:hypothetical protein n=1 Tax=Eubacterium sp. 14-2 TaxID=1235790 RepID=UPI000336AE16|nr:hypothetical protein [Eubacterium sp. 14-2]EOT28341.1 hypothetical protein C805_00483 [Eubacterium sp. 14-2]